MKALLFACSLIYALLPFAPEPCLHAPADQEISGDFEQISQLLSEEIQYSSSSASDKIYQIRTIVIDPGHGGHDPGCSGSFTHEKHVVLNIGLKLGQTIKAAFPHIRVIYTRDSDVFIPLHQRARIANSNKADLFISIHANSIPNANYIKGSETYVLGLHRAKDNLEVAKRENASILLEDNYQQNYAGYDPNSTENHIIMSMFQNAFLEQSISFASKVERQIQIGGHGKSRGVKQAGFLVLRETAMPSVLIESGYLTNASDDQYLSSDHGQTQIANAIYRAFGEYKAEVETGNISVQNPVTQQIVRAESRQKFVPPVSQPQVTRKSSPQLIIPSTSASSKRSADHLPALPAVEYKVQLASSPNLINTEIQPWSRIAQSIQVIQEGNRFKYLTQSYSSFEKAKQARKELLTLGFDDCFVVKYRGAERIP